MKQAYRQNWAELNPSTNYQMLTSSSASNVMKCLFGILWLSRSLQLPNDQIAYFIWQLIIQLLQYLIIMENTICSFERNYIIVIKTFQVTTHLFTFQQILFLVHETRVRKILANLPNMHFPGLQDSLWWHTDVLVRSLHFILTST